MVPLHYIITSHTYVDKKREKMDMIPWHQEMIGNDLFVCNFYITVSDFLNTNINGHLTNTDFYSEHCYAIVCYV